VVEVREDFHHLISIRRSSGDEIWKVAVEGRFATNELYLGTAEFASFQQQCPIVAG
jgi:hypothetical protein